MESKYDWIITSRRKTPSGKVVVEVKCPICKTQETVLSGDPDRCYTCGILLNMPKPYI